MKIEIMKYDMYNEFKIVIDGIDFTQNTKAHGFESYAAITAHILKEKYNATLVKGCGMLLLNNIEIIYKGKYYKIDIGKHSHQPDNARYFMNVMKSHMKHLDEAIAAIDTQPLLTFEV